MKKLLLLVLSMLFIFAFSACEAITTQEYDLSSPDREILARETWAMIENMGWQSAGTVLSSHGETVVPAGAWTDVVFPMPAIAENEQLYTTLGYAETERGLIVVAIMHAFGGSEPEGRLAGIYYALEGGPIVSATHFDDALLSADDETLWDFMLSRDREITEQPPALQEQQSGVTHEQFATELMAKGWVNVGTLWNGIGEDGITPAGFNVVFPAPMLSQGEFLYTTSGLVVRDDPDGEIVIAVAIMVVFEEGSLEGRVVGMYYALEGGPVVSAEHFDYELLYAHDETLWDFMLSYDN